MPARNDAPPGVRLVLPEDEKIDMVMHECRRLEAAWVEVLDHALRLRRLAMGLCLASGVITAVLIAVVIAKF